MNWANIYLYANYNFVTHQLQHSGVMRRDTILHLFPRPQLDTVLYTTPRLWVIQVYADSVSAVAVLIDLRKRVRFF